MLTLSPPNELSSAKLLVCFSFKVLKCRPKLVKMWSDSDPSCLHMEALLGGLRVKVCHTDERRDRQSWKKYISPHE